MAKDKKNLTLDEETEQCQRIAAKALDWLEACVSKRQGKGIGAASDVYFKMSQRLFDIDDRKQLHKANFADDKIINIHWKQPTEEDMVDA